ELALGIRARLPAAPRATPREPVLPRPAALPARCGAERPPRHSTLAALAGATPLNAGSRCPPERREDGAGLARWPRPVATPGPRRAREANLRWEAAGYGFAGPPGAVAPRGRVGFGGAEVQRPGGRAAHRRPR
ncbi:unnamed protein product, partial [Prorocentrum cordatum]